MYDVRARPTKRKETLNGGGIQRHACQDQSERYRAGFCSFVLINLLARVRPVCRQHAKRDEKYMQRRKCRAMPSSIERVELNG